MIKILLLLAALAFAANSYAKEYHFGATEWCPYTCASLPNKGIVSELMTEIFKKNGHDLIITFLPWSRAVDMASSGKIDGILTGVPSEAPDLKFTTTPTMSYNSCFYSTDPKQKKMTFKELKKYQIGVIDGYSYGTGFDHFFKNIIAKKNIFALAGKNPLKRFRKLIAKNRINFFVEEQRVAAFAFGNSVYPVLCGKKNSFYIGLNPKLKGIKKLISSLNKDIKSNRIKIEKIISKTFNYKFKEK